MPQPCLKNNYLLQCLAKRATDFSNFIASCPLILCYGQFLYLISPQKKSMQRKAVANNANWKKKLKYKPNMAKAHL